MHCGDYVTGCSNGTRPIAAVIPMAMIARPAAQRLGPAIPVGFGMLMKWLAENDDGVNCPWCGEAHAAIQGAQQAVQGGRRSIRNLKALKSRAKRRVSPYQKEFGRQLKKLKRAHPRTPVTRLMKRAHTATKKARRGK